MTETDYITSGLADAVALELERILIDEDKRAKQPRSPGATFARRR